MKKLLITCGGLECVTERVAEIQNLPQAALAFIFSDNFRFDSNTAWNHEFKRGAISSQQREHVPFEIAEQGRISDHAILNDLVQASSILPVRQRAKNIWIGNHQFRRIKCADEVLPFRKIYAGFSPDRAVYLRHKSGGNVNEAHTSQIGGCNESCNIANYAATNCHQGCVAIRTQADQRARDFFHGGETFRRLAVVE